MKDAGAIPFGEDPFVPAFLLRPVATGNTRGTQTRGDSDRADR